MRLSFGLFALLFAQALAWAQASGPVTLSGARLRVEVRMVDGRLEEQYQARQGSAWVTVAHSAGQSAGPVTVQGPQGEILQGAPIGAAMEEGALVERFSVGPHRVTRSIRLAESGTWLRVETRLEPRGRLELHSLADRFRFEGLPDWSYSPSVGGFNPDAQYKAPLILTQQRGRAFGVVPDLAVLTKELIQRCPHALDLDVPAGPLLSVGYIPTRMHFHSVYTRDLDRAWAVEQPVVNTYYLLVTGDAAPGEAFRQAVRLHWERFGRPQQATAAAQQVGTDAAYTSLGLWDGWRNRVWEQESRAQWLTVPLQGGGTGGAVRTLRWGQPRPSVYLSSWFNSARTAVGMALYARRRQASELLELATGTIRLALAAPGPEGAFKCIAVPGADGQVVWAAGDGAGESVKTGYLGFDMSWTGYWMLKWRAAGLPLADEILPRCRRLADFFLARQRSDGMIPTRFDEAGAPQAELSQMLMAETGPVALFLLELYEADRNPRYLQAALRALEFLDRQVVPQRKWYDYETFFSCSPRALSLDERTRQWPANNLALIPTVGAYLSAHRGTGKRAFLAQGEALLDYLLLYQQAWTNPVLENLSGPSMLLGGFTTQNSDAEWSDARQSQAGIVLLEYYRATGKAEYLERGVAALRSQFPISPSENWAHRGYGKKAGVSSFHWGTGSGMAGIELEEEFLHDVAVDVASGRAVGVNGVDVKGCRRLADGIELTFSSPFAWARQPVVAFHGAEQGRRYRVIVNGKELGVFAGKELAAGIAGPLAARPD